MAPPLPAHIASPDSLGSPYGYGSPHLQAETNEKQDSESKRTRNYQLPQLSGLRSPKSPSSEKQSVNVDQEVEKSYDEQATEDSVCEESSISSETNSETGSNLGTFDLANLKISPSNSQSGSHQSQKCKLKVGELIREDNVAFARHSRTFVKTNQSYRMALDCADPAEFCVGVILSFSQCPEAMRCDVLWDNGKVLKGYRVGFQGAYDLEVADSSRK
uniref:Uncharacterized protein n=1 Tax=Guillardia theta TaxID=55529 RepID=A0A7S4P4H5_GUITH|mmetsp:Transcript_43040/g.136015  ORF Transcript_43040/g.136015 Transcript_43040/m.136015 type:complete len:217 (+) Transcript_43040:280-930(+)